MIIFFTDEEKEWLEIDLSKDYTLKCKDDAPVKIKESIDRKISNHKKWLHELTEGIEEA